MIRHENVLARLLLLLVLLGLFTGLAYSGNHPGPIEGKQEQPSSTTPLKKPEPEPILIIYSGGEVFNQTIKGIEDELADEFFIFRMIVTKRTKYTEVVEKMVDIGPKMVVLMDNRSILLYKKYQETLKPGDFVVPSISLMAVNVKKAIKDLKNAAGIAYEIPLYTALIHFRDIVTDPIKRTGVIHREVLADFVRENKELCKKEGIDVFSIQLPDKSRTRDRKKAVKAALKELVERKRVDTIWVPNDNKLLDKRIIEDVWIPVLKKYKMSLIVGLEIFVQPEFNFGTFATLPDHIALGSQAAEMILTARDKNWSFENGKTENPISIRKIINYRQAGSRYRTLAAKLQSVDEVLK